MAWSTMVVWAVSTLRSTTQPTTPAAIERAATPANAANRRLAMPKRPNIAKLEHRLESKGNRPQNEGHEVGPFTEAGSGASCGSGAGRRPGAGARAGSGTGFRVACDMGARSLVAALRLSQPDDDHHLSTPRARVAEVANLRLIPPPQRFVLAERQLRHGRGGEAARCRAPRRRSRWLPEPGAPDRPDRRMRQRRGYSGARGGELRRADRDGAGDQRANPGDRRGQRHRRPRHQRQGRRLLGHDGGSDRRLPRQPSPGGHAARQGGVVPRPAGIAVGLLCRGRVHRGARGQCRRYRREKVGRHRARNPADPGRGSARGTTGCRLHRGQRRHCGRGSQPAPGRAA